MGYSPRVAVGSPEPGDRADRSLTGALAGKHWRVTLWSVPVSRPPPRGGSHAGRRAASRLGRHGGCSGGRMLRRAAALHPPVRRCTSEPARRPRPPEHGMRIRTILSVLVLFLGGAFLVVVGVQVRNAADKAEAARRFAAADRVRADFLAARALEGRRVTSGDAVGVIGWLGKPIDTALL